MGNFLTVLKKCALSNIMFIFLSFSAVALITASFFVPPLGVIDGSVLAAVGEIFAFAALWTVIKGMDEGHKATLSHGDTTLTIEQDNEEEE